jgi:hypothetical protein
MYCCLRVAVAVPRFMYMLSTGSHHHTAWHIRSPTSALHNDATKIRDLPAFIHVTYFAGTSSETMRALPNPAGGCADDEWLYDTRNFNIDLNGRSPQLFTTETMVRCLDIGKQCRFAEQRFSWTILM